MDPNTVPATISPTIITAVRATTHRVLRALAACDAPRKRWSCVKWSVSNAVIWGLSGRSGG